jgi:hypothetical protein
VQRVAMHIPRVFFDSGFVTRPHRDCRRRPALRARVVM